MEALGILCPNGRFNIEALTVHLCLEVLHFLLHLTSLRRMYILRYVNTLTIRPIWYRIGILLLLLPNSLPHIGNRLLLLG